MVKEWTLKKQISFRFFFLKASVRNLEANLELHKLKDLYCNLCFLISDLLQMHKQNLVNIKSISY